MGVCVSVMVGMGVVVGMRLWYSVMYLWVGCDQLKLVVMLLYCRMCYVCGWVKMCRVCFIVVIMVLVVLLLNRKFVVLCNVVFGELWLVMVFISLFMCDVIGIVLQCIEQSGVRLYGLKWLLCRRMLVLVCSRWVQVLVQLIFVVIWWGQCVVSLVMLVLQVCLLQLSMVICNCGLDFSSWGSVCNVMLVIF